VNVRRREFLRFAAAGFVEAGASAAWLCRSSADEIDHRAIVNVRSFGAVGDGKALDTAAVNRAIAAAAAAGSGIVHFPAGAYTCHSIRLKSFVTLYLEAGATILAAPAGGYDAAEPNEPFERYQDFGHNQRSWRRAARCPW
jgi:Pectate lyase superfamily protein